MPSQDEIDRFCGYCDKHKDPDFICEDQKRYVDRAWCGWASAGGERLYPVTDKLIGIGGIEYSRDDAESLEAALEALGTE